MIKASEIDSVMEKEVGIAMQYCKPKKVFSKKSDPKSDSIGTVYDQWTTEMKLENRKALFEEKTGQKMNTTRYAVYGYAIVPIRTIVNAVSGSEASLKAAKIPMAKWTELEGGSEPVVTTEWLKDLEKKDLKDPLLTPDDILKRSDECHTRKTKGTAYTLFHKTQVKKRHTKKKVKNG